MNGKAHTLGETLEAVDTVIGGDEAEDRVDDCLNGTTKESCDAVDEAGSELARSVDNRLGSAAAGSVLLEAPLDLLLSNRVAEEGVHATRPEPWEGKSGRRKERGEGERVLHVGE